MFDEKSNTWLDLFRKIIQSPLRAVKGIRVHGCLFVLDLRERMFHNLRWGGARKHKSEVVSIYGKWTKVYKIKADKEAERSG